MQHTLRKMSQGAEGVYPGDRSPKIWSVGNTNINASQGFCFLCAFVHMALRDNATAFSFEYASAVKTVLSNLTVIFQVDLH